MIEMTRLRLINWHNFQDEMIPFRMVTYLIGVNAVGKTTIMDAIRYCLTTNKEFNAAGNRRSGRTLQGSVHGKQRGENSYLRPGHTVAYVGVEFMDHEKNATFVIAVRIESESPTQDLRHVAQDWFLTKPGVGLEDLLFVDKNRRPSKKEAFKASSPGIRAPKTQTDARKYICRFLGIGDAESSLGKKFNDVFHMGTSLKEIPDIRTFIYTYILPDPEIRVEALQSDMRELERLEETLREAQQRAQSLGAIVESGKQALDLQTQVEINEGFILLAGLQKNLVLEEEYQCISEAADRALSQLGPELVLLKEKKKRAQDALIKAMREKDEDPEVQASQFYQDQEKEYQTDYRTQVRRQQAWYDSLKQLESLIKSMRSSDLPNDISLPCSGFAEWSLERQKGALNQLVSELSQVKHRIDDAVFQCRTEKETALADVATYTQELKVLRSGKMSYPPASQRLRDAINAEFTTRGMACDAKILSDLLYMEDDSWQECAEAALGFRRFDIIVSPAHYPAAKSVFTAMGDKVGDVSLVDTPGLMRDSKTWSAPEETMLAYKIGSENRNAKQYVNYLLHDIVCCADVGDLEQHSRSVTKDLLRYQSYRLQRMRTPTLYIGAGARKQRVAYLEAQLQKAGERQLALKQKEAQLTDLNQIYQTVTYEKHPASLINNLDARERVSALNEQLNAVRKKLKEYETNPLLAALFDRCSSCEAICKAIDEDMETLQKKIGAQEKIAKDAQKEIAQSIDDLDASKAAHEQFQLSHPELSEVIAGRYTEAARAKVPAEIERYQINYRNQCINARDKYILAELLPLQRSYNAKYTADYPTGLEGLSVYQDAYEALVRVELERSLENLSRAQIRCKERFRKEILFRMKDDIKNAKLQFRDLDRVMSELTYGEERYHFVIDDPRDKELASFNQIIMDKNNVQITDEENSLFTQAAMSEPAYEAQVDELMAKIMADVNQAAQDRSTGKKNISDQISKYVDYRTFLEYDIVVENVVTGMSIPLSKVSGDNSGGENQAPFYVAICASLLQIYRQSPNCIQLVLLDEAFNNMTSDRIEPMMKMFTAAHLQLVLISTVEKCSAVYPYCDIVYSIVKTGSRAVLAPFEKLYEGTETK